jgi:hypothetical protein
LEEIYDVFGRKSLPSVGNLFVLFLRSFLYCDRRVRRHISDRLSRLPAWVAATTQDEMLASAADGNDVGGVGGPVVASVMSDEAT